MLYGSKSLGNKDFKLFILFSLSLNNVNTWNMDNWVHNMSLQFGMIELEVRRNLRCSLSPPCLFRGGARAHFPNSDW